MKNLFLILFISISIGCASKVIENAPLSQEDKRISRLISSTNSNIWGLHGNKNNNDFTAFDQKTYEELLAKGKSRTAAEFRTVYGMFEPKEFSIYPQTFVLCAYSSKLKLAFCDDAACEGLEQIIRTNSNKNISDLKSKIAEPGICYGY